MDLDLTALIKKTIQNAPPEEKRPYIGASSIGKECQRAIWYGFTGAESSPIPPGLRTTFDIGNRLEAMLLDYMEQAGLTLSRASDGNDHLLFSCKEIPEFKGHADALLILSDSVAVVEIKTAKNTSFVQFISRGLQAWNTAYYAQMQAYLGMSGYEKGVFLIVNKDTSEIGHEWIYFDELYYQELCARAAYIVKAEEPPERINRSPLFWICSRCPYKQTCHAN